MFRIASTPGHRAFRERPVFFFCASPAREVSSAPGTSSSRRGAKSKTRCLPGRERRALEPGPGFAGLEGSDRRIRPRPRGVSRAPTEAAGACLLPSPPLWARVLVCNASGWNPEPATSSPSLFNGSFSSSPGASPWTRVRLRRPGFSRGTVESCSFIGRARRGRRVAQPRAKPRLSAAAKSSSPPAVRRRNSGAPTTSATVAFIPVLASMPTSRARTAVAAGVPPPTSSLIE